MDQSLLPVFNEPLCLIETDQSNKLSIKQEVLDQIRSIKQDLNIVTITGNYRTGKSYLMNRLAGVNKGFALGSTIESKTKGIWVWCRPHPVHRDQVLMLMDTEGLGDIKKGDKNHDNSLFALAVLLSSTLVYNIMGVFNEENLDKLSFVTEISNHIKNTKDGKEKDDSEFDLFFPMFIVTLRDFCLEIEKDGVVLSADRYLEEECLTLREENNDINRKFNECRNCIRKYFKYRKCFTFDRPGKRAKLKELEKLSDADLSKDFIDESNTFVAFVHENGPPKKLSNGHLVNGIMFAIMAQSYVDAIRNRAIPCIENAVITMIQIENPKAVDSALEIYNQEMEKCVKFPTADDKTLSNAHHQSMAKAVSFFLEKAILDKDEKYQKELNVKILEVYAKFQEKDELASSNACERRIKDLYAEIDKKIMGKEYARAGGYADYMKDLNEMETQYKRTPGLGCKAEVTFLTFLEGKNSECKTIQQADETITEKEKETEVERQKAITAARERQESDNLVKKLQEQNEDFMRQMAENVKLHEEKRKADLEEMKTKYEHIIEKRIEEERRLREEGFMAKAEEERRERIMLEQKIKEQEQVTNNNLADMLQKYFEGLKIDQTRTENEELRIRNHTLMLEKLMRDKELESAYKTGCILM